MSSWWIFLPSWECSVLSYFFWLVLIWRYQNCYISLFFCVCLLGISFFLFCKLRCYLSLLLGSISWMQQMDRSYFLLCWSVSFFFFLRIETTDFESYQWVLFVETCYFIVLVWLSLSFALLFEVNYSLCFSCLISCFGLKFFFYHLHQDWICRSILLKFCLYGIFIYLVIENFAEHSHLGWHLWSLKVYGISVHDLLSFWFYIGK